MGHRFVLAADQAPERIDKLVARLMPDVTRATVQRWIGEERVTVDGRICRARDKVRPGSVIVVEPGPPPTLELKPEPDVAFGILAEDDHIIVVDKPAGLVVHPARGHRTHTLVGGLLALPSFGRPPSDPLDPDGALRPGIVQRLDKDTSGVLVVAKTDVAREALKKQLAVHSVERCYRAITRGVPDDGDIRTLHGRHPTNRLKFTSRTERGRRAVTHVRVTERLASGRAAWVECRLDTGRTHQIRVHLAEVRGTPVLADGLYGGMPPDPELRPIAEQLGRQALHARVLAFDHPATGQRVRYESPVPDDMRRALERLRAA